MDEHLQDPVPWTPPALSNAYEWVEAPDEPEDAGEPAPETFARVRRAGLLLVSGLVLAGGLALLAASDMVQETVAGAARAPAGAATSTDVAKTVVQPGTVLQPRTVAPEIAVLEGEQEDDSRARVRVWRGTQKSDVNVIRYGRP